MKHIKKLLSVLLILALICAFMPTGALAASEYRVSVSASRDYVDIGETVMLDLTVTSTVQTSFNAFYVVVSYDPAVFVPDQTRLPRDYDFADSGDGRLEIIRVGGSEVLRDGAALSLPFLAISSGSARFSIASAKIDVAQRAEKDAPSAAIGSSATVTVRGAEITAAITVNRTEITPNGAFIAWLVLNGTPGTPVPAAAVLKMNYYSSTCVEAAVNPALTNGEVTYRGGLCSVSYSGFDGSFNDEGQLWLAEFTFSAASRDVLLRLKEATGTDESGTHGIAFEEGADEITARVSEAQEEQGSLDTSGLDLESAVWDGVTVDVSWYFEDMGRDFNEIGTAARLE